ncbi:putative membrane protein [Roseivirga pacifica]|uniref:Uncharacterized membrane protein n=1 Tax=Roseivirga pacifica TaxID=1267423 RepID=A0A1I0Q685_9BACT|nr:heparan-alpha-glucosaminide N-acetyltransferase domain-containing protein [Roseivirga pacifica]RKQ43209.1 putative membrane protein [Roseivirga pacifica]SEW22396.1 Uncharacterized membrane protein [Roseivirga pacifica]
MMAKKRISSIDILRGLVMMIMLVDHVRERFFLHEQVLDPMDVSETSSGLFFTRMAAHLCAPIFVFLTGLSAWLYANPIGKPARSASQFLLKRGLFLVLLEVTVINFSWFGRYETLYLQVIWAIGLSMISLALLCKLPRWCIGLLGLAIVFGHNALSFVSFTPNESGYALWTILHDRGYLVSEGWLQVKISYPVLPWIGVILLGFFAGPLFGSGFSAMLRKQWLIALGTACLLLLILLRGFNIYGETLPWQEYDSAVVTAMSFFNFTKYPPSLDFLLLTLGIGFFTLHWFENRPAKWMDVLKNYGAAPMFFYILHLYVLLIAYQACVGVFGTNKGAYFGVDSLWQVWAIALALIGILYLPTKKFAAYKHNSKAKWIKYF